MKKALIIGLLLFCGLTFSQQKTLQGFVTDSLNKPVINATVVVKSAASFNYAIADNKGFYQIKLTTTSDSLLIEARSLGYKKFTQILFLKPTADVFKKNIVLQHETKQLKEVVIESQRKIIARKDTVIYNINYYTDKTEQTVEDVLKKLPGIEVTEDGTIKYNGKSIEKVLIEGEDLVNKNYQILTKNLDANVLKNVQVLRNYNDNPVQKSFYNAQRVALNLTIKNNKKNILFGMLSVGLGTKSKYKHSANIGLLKKQLKFLNLTNINNVGVEVTKQLHENSYQQEDVFSNNSVKEARITPIVANDLDYQGGLNKEQYLNNNSKSNALTISSKLNKKTTLRSLIYIGKDKLLFDKFTTSNYFFDTDTISFFENKHQQVTKQNFQADVSLKNYSGNRFYTTFTTKFYKLNTVNSRAINSNNSLRDNDLATDKVGYLNHLKMTYKISDALLLENYGFYSIVTSQQDFTISNPNFGFANNFSTIEQKSQQKDIFYGFNSALSYQKNSNKLRFLVLL